MIPGNSMMQATLAQALEDLHTRIAATILGLDEAALAWQPSQALPSVRDLIRHAATEERRWIGEGVANIPATDESSYAVIQFSSGQAADNALFELGSVGQVSQMILGRLGPTDWEEVRSVEGHSITVAGCVLQTLIELSRILGHIESISHLWDTAR